MIRQWSGLSRKPKNGCFHVGRIKGIIYHLSITGKYFLKPRLLLSFFEHRTVSDLGFGHLCKDIPGRGFGHKCFQHTFVDLPPELNEFLIVFDVFRSHFRNRFQRAIYVFPEMDHTFPGMNRIRHNRVHINILKTVFFQFKLLDNPGLMNHDVNRRTHIHSKAVRVFL